MAGKCFGSGRLVWGPGKLASQESKGFSFFDIVNGHVAEENMSIWVWRICNQDRFGRIDPDIG